MRGLSRPLALSEKQVPDLRCVFSTPLWGLTKSGRICRGTFVLLRDQLLQPKIYVINSIYKEPKRPVQTARPRFGNARARTPDRYDADSQSVRLTSLSSAVGVLMTSSSSLPHAASSRTELFADRSKWIPSSRLSRTVLPTRVPLFALRRKMPSSAFPAATLFRTREPVAF